MDKNLNNATESESDLKRIVRQTVEEILLDGGSVAFYGDPFKSEEENKKAQEKYYEEAIQEGVNKILSMFA